MNDALFDMAEFSLPHKEQDNSPTSIGTMAEIKFLNECAQRGITCFVPIGHAQKADCVVWCPPTRPVTVQVKKAYLGPGHRTWKIQTCSTKPTCLLNPKDFGQRYTNYADGDFDILAAYIGELDCFALWRLHEISGGTSIRWDSNAGRKNNFDVIQKY